MVTVATIDMTLARDSDVLKWFDANNFQDLSLAFSNILRINVSFPDAEDGIDDTRTDIWVDVFGTGLHFDYPMTMGDFLEDVVRLVDESQERQNWTEFAESVRRVEQVPVLVWRTPFAPFATWQDDLILDGYPYRRRVPDQTTVAGLRRTRLADRGPFFQFDFPRPDGTLAAPQTRIGTLRRAWSALPDDAASWLPPDVSSLGGRIGGMLRIMEMLGI